MQMENSVATGILGADFITPEEVACRRNLVYRRDQIDFLTRTTPSVKVLELCKRDNYVVMAGPPVAMSILDIRALKPHYFDSWDERYTGEKFAREDTILPGWLLIKKVPLLHSTSKTWEEQIKLLSPEEHVPNAAEVAWLITTYCEVRSVRLFEGVFVRTSSMWNGFCASVGNFPRGTVVNCYWRNEWEDRVALLAARNQWDQWD